MKSSISPLKSDEGQKTPLKLCIVKNVVDDAISARNEAERQCKEHWKLCENESRALSAPSEYSTRTRVKIDILQMA